MYLDGSGPVDIRLDLPAGAYAGEWIDPKSGRREAFRQTGGSVVLHTPEFQDGIALQLKR